MPTHKTKALNLRPSKHQSRIVKPPQQPRPSSTILKTTTFHASDPGYIFAISFSIKVQAMFQEFGIIFSLLPQESLLRCYFRSIREFYLQMTDERETETEKETESGVALAFRKSRRFNRIGRLLEGWGVGGGGSCCVFLRWRGKARFKGGPGDLVGPGIDVIQWRQTRTVPKPTRNHVQPNILTTWPTTTIFQSYHVLQYGCSVAAWIKKPSLHIESQRNLGRISKYCISVEFPNY